MALEDAVELAHLLKCSNNNKKALRLFETQRYARTADMVRDSKFLGIISRWSHPFLKTVRNSVGFWIFSKWMLNKYAGYRVPSLFH